MGTAAELDFVGLVDVAAGDRPCRKRTLAERRGQGLEQLLGRGQLRARLSASPAMPAAMLSTMFRITATIANPTTGTAGVVSST
jgi:hypothetical protein